MPKQKLIPAEDLTDETIAAACLIAKLEEVLHHLQVAALRAQLAIRTLDQDLAKIRKKAGL